MHPDVSSESLLVRSRAAESRLSHQLSGGGGDEDDGVAVSSLRRRRRLSSAALGSPSSPSAASSLVGSLLSVSEEAEAEVESAGWEVTAAPPEGPETEESSGPGLSAVADAVWLASVVLPSVRGGVSVATVLR